MKSLFRLLVCLGLLLATPALAAPACYGPAQVEAEQWLRLHSELMVITVTCRQSSDGRDLVAAYTDFTKRNIAPLHEAEQTLVAYYKAHKGRDALEQLDQLRTVLGNEFGQKSATMTAPAFCAAYRDRVMDFDAAPTRAVVDEVHRMEISMPSNVPPCARPATTVARKG